MFYFYHQIKKNCLAKAKWLQLVSTSLTEPFNGDVVQMNGRG